MERGALGRVFSCYGDPHEGERLMGIHPMAAEGSGNVGDAVLAQQIQRGVATSGEIGGAQSERT